MRKNGQWKVAAVAVSLLWSSGAVSQVSFGVRTTRTDVTGYFMCSANLLTDDGYVNVYSTVSHRTEELIRSTSRIGWRDLEKRWETYLKSKYSHYISSSHCEDGTSVENVREQVVRSASDYQPDNEISGFWGGEEISIRDGMLKWVDSRDSGAPAESDEVQHAEPPQSNADAMNKAREALEAKYQAELAEYERLTREREEAIRAGVEKEESNRRQLEESRRRAEEAQRKHQEEVAKQQVEYERRLLEHNQMLANGDNCRVTQNVAVSGITPTEMGAIAGAQSAVPLGARMIGTPQAKWVDFSVSDPGGRDFIPATRGWEGSAPYEREICSGQATPGRRQ